MEILDGGMFFSTTTSKIIQIPQRWSMRVDNITKMKALKPQPPSKTLHDPCPRLKWVTVVFMPSHMNSSSNQMPTFLFQNYNYRFPLPQATHEHDTSFGSSLPSHCFICLQLNEYGSQPTFTLFHLPSTKWIWIIIEWSPVRSVNFNCARFNKEWT